MKKFYLLTGAAALVAASCGPPPPPAPVPRPPTAARRQHLLSARPADDSAPEEETDQQAWDAIRKALGKAGDLHDGVLTITFPRDDLELLVQDNEVPAAAGIASQFHFFRCPCGRINAIGQFVVADYEANDVIDALREGHVEVASVGPLLLHERPRLLLVRFQGEDKRGGTLAKVLRDALTWTGRERMAPQKVE